MLIVGQAAPEGTKPDGKRVIEADEFVVSDTKGNPRIRIGTVGSLASIKILDRNGKAAVQLSSIDENLYWSYVSVRAASGATACKRRLKNVALGRVPLGSVVAIGVPDGDAFSPNRLIRDTLAQTIEMDPPTTTSLPATTCALRRKCRDVLGEAGIEPAPGIHPRGF